MVTSNFFFVDMIKHEFSKLLQQYSYHLFWQHPFFENSTLLHIQCKFGIFKYLYEFYEIYYK